MEKVSPYLNSSFLCILSQRYLLRLFFPNNMEGSKKTTTFFRHLCSSTKKKLKYKKRCNLMIESLLSRNTSNHFKFVVTPTRGKHLWPSPQKWNYDSYLQENQGLQATCSCNLFQVSLENRQFAGARYSMSGVNIYYLNHIKPQIVY